MTRVPLLALLLPSIVWATMFVQRPLPDQVEETPTVVRGTIGSSHGDWGGAGTSRRLYTYYQLRVTEVLKGDADSGSITIRELGGEKDGIGMQIAGAAKFSLGEDVVVFLGKKNDDGSYDIRGLSSGKFNLSQGPEGAECLSGIALTQPDTDGFVHPDENGSGGTSPSSHCAWTLTALRQLIRDQGNTPSPVAMPSLMPRPVTSTRAFTRASTPVPSEAPQLQPSTPEQRASGGGRLWIVVLAIGLAGLVLLLLPKSKR